MPVLSAGAGLHETLALLTSQLHPDANHKQDMVFLKEVFSEKSLGYLMKIHEKLRQYERQSPAPLLHSASSLAEDVADELQNGPMSSEEKELLQLLTSPHVKAVISVHDTVAQKNFDPILPPLPDDLEDDLEEESVKIVRLVKNKEPLGATIRRDETTGAVIVARIMRGGAADRSGLVHVGDELREVNSVSIVHKRPDEISQLLSQSQGSITLKIIPAIKEEDRLKESKVYMRALFDYVPTEDKATPCQEAGLPFSRGDILQVVSQDDPTWWQAKRVGDSNLRAGLIPSKQFQERRLAHRIKMGTLQPPKSPRKHLYDQGCDGGGYILTQNACSSYGNRSALPFTQLWCPLAHPAHVTLSVSAPAGLHPSLPRPLHPVAVSSNAPAPSVHPLFPLLAFPTEDCDCEGYVNGQYVAGLRRSFRLSRKDRRGSPSDTLPQEPGEPEFVTYEEVTRYQQNPNEQPRLVVLIGSLGAKINELKQKVIAEDPHRYGVAVPHTTRPKKSHEKEGVEYHFVSKQAFDADVQNNKFIEHGEYKENQYGTSMEAIQSVQSKNKMCLVDVQPEALKTLRTAEFKPYVIFVRPQIPEARGQHSGGDQGRLTDEEIEEIRQSALQIDQQHGHLLDRVLVKGDTASASAELQCILDRLEREAFWVPVSWVRS
ncbi:hypothetical protein SKAU_G00289950 [Synaphobranchus kaupii]|uniref:Uncharacterized protein n=1 Tax=Synaphobranchus kaupii TaxID=118154 RepID=A0A9Q1IL84_SYNKA|nr:hypothetical protein SKAU_G00289950 [Synaphobranchus kaupii]